MITECNEIWLPDHNICAATKSFRAQALRYRLKRLELQFNPKGFMNKFAILFILLAATIGASAQPEIGYGASVIRSSSYDPSPTTSGDGGKTFAGAYVETRYRFPRGFSALALFEYRGEPTLESIFTSDANTGRRARDEFHLRIEPLRYSFGEGSIKPFVGAGADVFWQRIKCSSVYFIQISANEYAYLPTGPSSNCDTVAGLNPYVTAGARIGRGHEASYAYLFTDTTSLNNSRLRGHRASYSYTSPRVLGPFALKIEGQADYVYFRDSVYDYVATYYKRDAVFILRIGLLYRQRYR